MEREFVEFVYNWVLGQLRINACLCQRLKLDSGRSAWLWTEGQGGRCREVSCDDLGCTAARANLCHCTGHPSS